MIIHGLTCCSLYYLLKLLGNEGRSAAIFTALYLAAPLFVQSIAWAPSRGDLLIGLTTVLSLIFFIRYLDTLKIKHLVFLWITFLVAIFSKETAVLIPAALLGFYFLVRKAANVPVYKLIVAFGGFLPVMALYYFLRVNVVNYAVPGTEFGLTPLLHNLRTIPELAGKFFIPVHLSPMPGFSAINTITGLIVIGLLLWLTFRFIRKTSKAVLFGLFWFILFAIPGMMYTHTFGVAAYEYLEHRAYLPVIGLVLFLVTIFNTIDDAGAKSRILQITMVLTLFFGFYTFVYAGNYKDPVAFFDRAVATNGKSAVALYNRGCLKAEIDDYQGAISDYNEAIRIKHDYASAWLNRGVAFSTLHDIDNAYASYDSAIIYQPTLFQAHVNMASIDFQNGKLDKALSGFTNALKIYPGYSPCFVERGKIYLQQKNYRAASGDFNSAISNDKSNAVAYLLRGEVSMMEGDTVSACTDWKTAAGLGDEHAGNFSRQYCK